MQSLKAMPHLSPHGSTVHIYRSLPDQSHFKMSADETTNILEAPEEVDKLPGGEETDSTETDQLLSKVENVSCRRPRLVEPVLFLFAFGYFSFTLLIQQFLKHRMDEMYSPFQVHVSKENVNPHHQYNDTYKDYSTIISWSNYNSQFIMDYFTLEASSQAAYQYSLLVVFRSIPPCFTGLIICSCTDTIGRKIGLLLPVIGGIIRSIVYLIVVIYQLPLQWLYIAEFVDGVLGDHLVLLGCSYAYISDTAASGQLVFRFLIANSVYLTAGSIANFVSGYAVEVVGFEFAFTLPLITLGLALLYILIILPESLHEERRKEFSLSSILTSLVHSLVIVHQSGETRQERIANCSLLGGAIIGSFVYTGNLDLLTMYVQGPPFSMSPAQIGLMFGLSSIISVVIQPIYGRILQMFMSDELISVTMAITSVIQLLLTGLSGTSTQVFTGKFQS